MNERDTKKQAKILKAINDGYFQGQPLAKHTNYGELLDGIEAQNVDLSKTELTDMRIKNIQLPGANLEGASLFRTELKNANLTGANMTEMKLIKSTLINVNFTNAILLEMKISGTTIIDSNFDRAVIDRPTLRALRKSGVPKTLLQNIKLV